MKRMGLHLLIKNYFGFSIPNKMSMVLLFLCICKFEIMITMSGALEIMEQ